PARGYNRAFVKERSASTPEGRPARRSSLPCPKWRRETPDCARVQALIDVRGSLAENRTVRARAHARTSPEAPAKSLAQPLCKTEFATRSAFRNIPQWDNPMRSQQEWLNRKRPTPFLAQIQEIGRR